MTLQRPTLFLKATLVLGFLIGLAYVTGPDPDNPYRKQHKERGYTWAVSEEAMVTKDLQEVLMKGN